MSSRHHSDLDTVKFPSIRPKIETIESQVEIDHGISNDDSESILSCDGDYSVSRSSDFSSQSQIDLGGFDVGIGVGDVIVKRPSQASSGNSRELPTSAIIGTSQITSSFQMNARRKYRSTEKTAKPFISITPIPNLDKKRRGSQDKKVASIALPRSKPRDEKATNLKNQEELSYKNKSHVINLNHKSNNIPYLTEYNKASVYKNGTEKARGKQKEHDEEDDGSDISDGYDTDDNNLNKKYPQHEEEQESAIQIYPFQNFQASKKQSHHLPFHIHEVIIPEEKPVEEGPCTEVIDDDEDGGIDELEAGGEVIFPPFFRHLRPPCGDIARATSLSSSTITPRYNSTTPSLSVTAAGSVTTASPVASVTSMSTFSGALSAPAMLGGFPSLMCSSVHSRSKQKIHFIADYYFNNSVESPKINPPRITTTSPAVAQNTDPSSSQRQQTPKIPFFREKAFASTFSSSSTASPNQSNELKCTSLLNSNLSTPHMYLFPSSKTAHFKEEFLPKRGSPVSTGGISAPSLESEELNESLVEPPIESCRTTTISSTASKPVAQAADALSSDKMIYPHEEIETPSKKSSATKPPKPPTSTPSLSNLKRHLNISKQSKIARSMSSSSSIGSNNSSKSSPKKGRVNNSKVIKKKVPPSNNKQRSNLSQYSTVKSSGYGKKSLSSKKSYRNLDQKRKQPQELQEKLQSSSSTVDPTKLSRGGNNSISAASLGSVGERNHLNKNAANIPAEEKENELFMKLERNDPVCRKKKNDDDTDFNLSEARLKQRSIESKFYRRKSGIKQPTSRVSYIEDIRNTDKASCSSSSGSSGSTGSNSSRADEARVKKRDIEKKVKMVSTESKALPNIKKTTASLKPWR